MPKPEPDLSEFVALTRKSLCKVAYTLGQLPTAERVNLEAALACDNGRFPHNVIRRWIVAKAPELGAMMPTTEGIARHRKKECSCG